MEASAVCFVHNWFHWEVVSVSLSGEREFRNVMVNVSSLMCCEFIFFLKVNCNGAVTLCSTNFCNQLLSYDVMML